MLTPWKESYDQSRQHIKKLCLVKAMVFPVVMNGCESWTINKAECRRIDVEAETLILWPPDAKN